MHPLYPYSLATAELSGEFRESSPKLQGLLVSVNPGSTLRCCREGGSGARHQLETALALHFTGTKRIYGSNAESPEPWNVMRVALTFATSIKML